MSSTVAGAPALNLNAFLKSLKTSPLDSSIESLISLLKRRQIRNSRACAVATAHLLLRVVTKFRWSNVGKLLQRVQDVGQRLIEAQPREMVVGNIVRRVLGMIRDEAEEDRAEDLSDSASSGQVGSPTRQHNEIPDAKVESTHTTPSRLRFGSTDAADLSDMNEGELFASRPAASSRPPLITSHTSYAVLNGVPVQQSMFNLLSATPSPNATPPGIPSPHSRNTISAASLAYRIASTSKDLKAEITSGIEEIIDELDQVDDQIAGYSQEHIHSNEVILTHSYSMSVQKFLLKAAEKRTFTVVIAESYPNDHEATHRSVTNKTHGGVQGTIGMETEDFLKPLSAAGITVILITDASIFAIMSRVNKVILATHAVIANGGLIAAAGAKIIAKAARVHRTPVIVVSGVYKLSPEYPFEFESLIEYGDPGNILAYENGDMVDRLEVDNPIFDYVPPDLVDLFITNLGAHAPSYLYRIVADHYKQEDVNFNKPELQF